MQLSEFDIIQQYFTKQADQTDLVLGVGDDCAVISPSPNKQMLITIDTLTAGIHFPLTTSAEDIGHKVMAISLSDIAAMGGVPRWAMLALSLADVDEQWLDDFCKGFFGLAVEFNVVLIGGDTCAGGLSITSQLCGEVDPGQAIRRDGAQVGDFIYVTGTFGDAGLALAGLADELLPCLNRPQPRVREGQALVGFASAAIDVSDGLAADCQHILHRSHVGAEIELDKLPLSDVMRNTVKPEQAWQYALSSGDDYELCFTIPAAQQQRLHNTFAQFDCGCYCIGRIVEGSGLSFIDPQGKPWQLERLGYEHFG